MREQLSASKDEEGSWQLWATRGKDGTFRNIGERRWVLLHYSADPTVPVTVTEVSGDLHTREITHYGWRYSKSSPYRRGDVPTMIQRRVPSGADEPRKALMLLDLCFPCGLDSAIKQGAGEIVALRVKERQDEA